MVERTKVYRGSAAGDQLTQAAWHIFALAKLRMYPSAAEELAALGPLDAPQHEGACICCMQACMHVARVCTMCSMPDGERGWAFDMQAGCPLRCAGCTRSCPRYWAGRGKAASSCTACWSSAAGRRAAPQHLPLVQDHLCSA